MTFPDSLQKVTLLLAWLSALAGAAVITAQQSGAATQFTGIADDLEQAVRFTTPVEIMRLEVVSGQSVTLGDLVVEVRQPELDADLQVLDERLRALASGALEERASMQAAIVQHAADLRATLTDVDTEIRVLRARQSAARALVGDRLGDTPNDRGDSTIAQALQNLQQRRQALGNSTAARIGDLRARLANASRPVDAQIAEVRQQQRELQRQRSEQRVYAKLDGQVGSVLFRIGDKVPPFQPVLTLHGTRPSFIKGYIHESVLNDVRLGQTVWIQSANSAHAGQWCEGVVASLGSRIVDYPVRLKVSPMLPAWGREVLVRLQGDHQLLLGERVNVQLHPPGALGNQVKALLAEYAP